MRILITGASGFVGRRLSAELLSQGHVVRAAVRSPALSCEPGLEVVAVGAIAGETDWTAALAGVEAVVHLASRVHVMRETACDPLAEFLRVNLHGTVSLARQAVAAGVRRFIFVSSIKVNGERTLSSPSKGVDLSPCYQRRNSSFRHAVSRNPVRSKILEPGLRRGDGIWQYNGLKSTALSPPCGQAGGEEAFSESATPNPQDPYGISKWQAEQALRQVAEESGLEVVIIRPPLVYGPGVKANFVRLLAMVHRGLPLPFSSIKNGRSLVFLGNLVHFIGCCLSHPAAAGQTFLVADAEVLSTPALIEKMAQALGKTPNLWPCPSQLLRLLGALCGRAAEVGRLCDSLRVDCGKAWRVLGWRPPFTAEQGIRETARWYLENTHA